MEMRTVIQVNVTFEDLEESSYYYEPGSNEDESESNLVQDALARRSLWVDCENQMSLKWHQDYFPLQQFREVFISE